nr:PREDICTED: cytochrome P450 2C23-like [Anolis carolinensis]|eukprot:XP_016850311.1 PREDICTED: cytochrome P450 2C23-like [Anolis carolinensis]
MVTIFLLVFLCVGCILLLSWKSRRETTILPLGPTPLPILGNFLQLDQDDLLKSLIKVSKVYGPVFTVYLGLQKIVVLCGYEAVKEALVEHAEAFAGRGQVPVLSRFLKEHGIVFSNGERWKQLRRFTVTTLRNFGMGKGRMEEKIQVETLCLVEEFNKTEGRPSTFSALWLHRTQPSFPLQPLFLPGNPFNPMLLLNWAVANIISSILFGKRFEYSDAQFFRLRNLMANLYSLFPEIMDKIPGMHRKMAKIGLKIVDIIKERIETQLASFDASDPQNYIECFLVKMEQPDFGIQIAFSPSQEKVHKEIDRVVGQGRMPTVKDRNQMPYTTAVLNEIQRLADVVPMNLPHFVTQDTHFRGYVIPKGTYIYPLLNSVHYDKHHHANPEEFDPGRFLDRNGCLKKVEAFMPFSTGKRACLGEGLARMILFLFFTTILQKFTLTSPEPPEKISIAPAFHNLTRIPPQYKLSMVPRQL